MSDEPRPTLQALALSQIHMGPRVWSMEMRALRTAAKTGRGYQPVTDRMKQALENGRAPEPFASAFRKSLS